MAFIQKHLDTFNKTIRLGRFEENEILREKRDIIRQKLTDVLPAIFAQYNEDYPEPVFYDQGSYNMGTGIKPLDGDYDIDQGVYFPISKDCYPDPVTLKKRVHEALYGHTNKVVIRQPCVTVVYQRANEPLYHVDLAIYSDGNYNVDGQHRLARGKEYSEVGRRIWEASDQAGLAATFTSRFEGIDGKQFRRVVRYLKRWKDLNFPKEGYAAPRGIGLTVLVYNHLVPTYIDRFAGSADDLSALQTVVNATLGSFTCNWDTTGNPIWQIIAQLPTAPYNDLFERMTSLQKAESREKLILLQTVLNSAATSVDPVEACSQLQGVFGNDFPIPAQEDTGKKHLPAIISSSNSA